MRFYTFILTLFFITQLNAQNLECCKTSADVLKTLKGFWKKKNSHLDLTYHYWIEDASIGMDEIETIETETEIKYITPSCQPKIGVLKSEQGFSIKYWHHLHLDEEETRRIAYLDATTLILIENNIEVAYYKIPKLF